MTDPQKKSPHMWFTALDPPRPDYQSRRWQCQYCGAADTLEKLRAIACTYVYPPCKTCGQTPECAPNCKTVLGALTQPGVAVVGGSGPRKPLN